MSILVLAVLALTALLPSAAHAVRNYQLELMDDQLLLGASDQQIADGLDEMVELGADRLRVSAFWRDIAPAPDSSSRPAFAASDPNDPGYRWGSLDRVVVAARERKLDVMISISGPGPLWASADPSKGRLWKPSPTDFADFAAAVATRYTPAVDRFALFNEPNQAGWLQPQSECTGSGRSRRCELFAPHHYRDMVRASFPRVKAAAPRAQVLMGELASSGRDQGTREDRPIRPLDFLRAMACRDSRYRAIRTGPCQGFRAATADAIGHHPYSLFVSPSTRSRERSDAAFGDTSRLTRVIDKLQRLKGLRKDGSGRFSLHYTEFGYQTDPPDPYAGVSLSRQSAWLQEAAYLAWRHSRVRTLSQFRITDGAIRDDLGGGKQFLEFQSGLRFADGRAKPALRTFPVPIQASRTRIRKGSSTVLWGQIRPGRSHGVIIERRSGSRWVRETRTTTDRYGSFRKRLRPSRTTKYRFRYDDGSSAAVQIRVVR
ncbi:MAG: hypothetical protein ACR2NA_13875 [Solirubrobacterales bacterium]